MPPRINPSIRLASRALLHGPSPWIQPQHLRTLQSAQRLSTSNHKRAPEDSPSSSSSSSPQKPTFSPPPPPPPATPRQRFSQNATSTRAQDRQSAKYEAMDLSRIISDDMHVFSRQFDRGPAPDIRLAPATGRTVHVRGGDFGAAANGLDRLCSRNKLRSLKGLQRFHERPSLKRKRLRMARWRVRFKEGFVATVKRVQELKSQGW